MIDKLLGWFSAPEIRYYNDGETEILEMGNNFPEMPRYQGKIPNKRKPIDLDSKDIKLINQDGKIIE